MIRQQTSQRATVGELLQQARQALLEHATAQLDAELLLAYVLDSSRAALYAHPDSRVDATQTSDFLSLLSKRAAGVPLAYLTGVKEFWSLPFAVNSAALIPRPETECLVELALQQVPEDKAFCVLDLGTGSGAIAIAIASERPGCRVIATDIDAAVLDLAHSNAIRLGVTNVSFIQSDWFSGLHQQSFDLILSNPPYIDTKYPGLADSELSYEPRLALDGGHLGLEAYRRIIPSAIGHLQPGGYLLLEHGYDQAPAVTQLFTSNHYQQCKTSRDFAGLDRITYARRK